MSAIQQLAAWIWGKMTPVLQLSDVSATYPFKRFLAQHQVNLRREVRAKHSQEGTQVSYKCGFYEMLRLVSQALDDLDEYMNCTTRERTIRDSVGTGLLAYRPNLATGKLERTIDQPWARELKLKIGNHRMDEAWISSRYSFLDSTGKPIGPFAESQASLLYSETHDKPSPPKPDVAAELKKMEDVEYETKLDENGEPMEAIETELDFDLRSFDENELNALVTAGEWLDKLSARRVLRSREYDNLLQKSYEPKAPAAKRKRRELKLKAKHATRGDALAALQKSLELHSRKQLLDAIVPGTEPVRIAMLTLHDFPCFLVFWFFSFFRGRFFTP